MRTGGVSLRAAAVVAAVIAAGATVPLVGLPLAYAALVLRPVDQPAATAPFACADIDGGPPINGPTGVSASIDAVQTGRLPGFERVVLSFAGPVPHYAVSRRQAPVFATQTQTGDADDVRLRGAFGLEITSTWGSSEGFLGDRRAGPIGPTGVGGRLWDIADGTSVLGLGLSRPAPFRATTVASPSRLVVDVASGPMSCDTAPS